MERQQQEAKYTAPPPAIEQCPAPILRLTLQPCGERCGSAGGFDFLTVEVIQIEKTCASWILINANDGQPQHHLRHTGEDAATVLDCYNIARQSVVFFTRFHPSDSTRFCRLLRLASGFLFQFAQVLRCFSAFESYRHRRCWWWLHSPREWPRFLQTILGFQ